MKFTLSLLKKFLDTNFSVQEISEKLTSVGLEVEEIIDKREELKSFIVAEIIEAEQHPNADSLRLCKVNTGTEILQIVCGAPNARAGIKVVLAKVGAIIPNGQFKIKASAIRGVESNGMLCSEEELLIGKDTSGIIELPVDAILGNEFTKYYGIDDPVFEISVTPNRADCLGVYGIARDLAAAGAGTFIALPLSGGINHKQQSTQSEISSCFITRKFENIKNVESPAWLQKLLRNIGKEPISALVDITNYISLAFARPLHVYDADKVKLPLIVDYAKNGEKIKALDGKEYDLKESDIVIRDESRALGIAGIIGGENSAVSLDTENIILESALFDADHISKTSRRLMIDSDARHRFERGVDHDFTLSGLLIASDMISEFCGGNALEVSIVGTPKSEDRFLDFDLNLIPKLLGIEIAKEKVVQILEDLGFRIKNEKEILKLRIPSWRNDVSIKEDIIEEIIRIYGFDKLPKMKLPSPDRIESRIYTQIQRKCQDFRRIAAFRGFDEVVTWSFMPSVDAKLFSDLKDELHLANPITIDLDYMRPSIVPNMLGILKLNQSRSIDDLALFELGPIFEGIDPKDEKITLSAIRSGNFSSKTPLEAERKVDIYDIKSDLEALLLDAGFSMQKLQISREASKYYHPGRSGTIKLGKNLLAVFGELHPRILKHYGIDGPVVAFELIISNLPDSKLKYGKKAEYTPSDYQIVSRDFAFILPIDIKALDIEKTICGIDNQLIKKFEIFDIYHGEKIDYGYKSVAFRILLQANDRTLSDSELQDLSSKIIDLVEQKFSGKLR